MFLKLEDFYTQEIRIDLVPAERLAAFNPDLAKYRSAADRGELVVTVLQGDVYESVYASLMERFFETLAEAQLLYERLVAEHPNAAHFDFVANPSGRPPGLSVAPHTKCDGTEV